VPPTKCGTHKPIWRGNTVSSISENSQCERCAFELGVKNFDCCTGEWEFDCCRCGFQEYLEVVVNEDGERIGWRRELIRAYGAQSVVPMGIGITRLCALRSAKELKEAALRVRQRISESVLAQESYVTQWDDDTKTVRVLAGKWNEPPAP
jgi:hypothetical protein